MKAGAPTFTCKVSYRLSSTNTVLTVETATQVLAGPMSSRASSTNAALLLTRPSALPFASGHRPLEALPVRHNTLVRHRTWRFLVCYYFLRN